MLRARGLGVKHPERTVATVDHIVPTRDQRRPFGDVMAEDMLAALERNCRGSGVPTVRPAQRRAGDRPRHRAGAGADAAGDDHRVRRQSHLDARRIRRRGVRHRHVAGPRRARVAVPGDGSAEGAPHQRDRAPDAGRVRQGRDPRNHQAPRRERRRGFRLRVCRRHHRAHVDGRAHDDLQHVDRGRCARRLRQSGPGHHRLPARQEIRAAGRGLRHRIGLVAEPRVRCTSAALRRRGANRRGGDPADASPGGSIRVSRCSWTRRCRGPPTSRPASAPRSPKRSTSWGSARARRSRARRSTWRSSARAPTPGCRICAKPPASSAAITWRRTSRRSSCRDRRRCAPRPSARGSTASSPRRASNGAAPAARCAWR